jgi:hypothetical protein
LDGFPDDKKPKLQWLLGRLNLFEVAHDDVYAMEYFNRAFVSWAGHQIRQGPNLGPADYKNDEEILASLRRAEAVLRKQMRTVRKVALRVGALLRPLGWRRRPAPPNH